MAVPYGPFGPDSIKAPKRGVRQTGAMHTPRGGGPRRPPTQHDRTGSPGLLAQAQSGRSGMQPMGPGGMGFDDIMAMLGGGGGGGVDTGALAGSFDAEINALRQGGQRMSGLTNQLIGNIQSSAGSANKQIGGFFDYAASQAQAGRPVIGETYDTAKGNVNQTYDQLASQIGGLPQSTADAARAAGGAAAGSSVADRVAVAAAPFAAAGESSRAATQANLATHSAAGQDYLTQLAAAAPSEAAQSQAAVTGRANMAVTNAQMQLAAQQAEIEARAASIEGSKQRALLEASADTAGSTFERMMEGVKLMSGLQSIGMAPMGPHAQSEGGMSPKDMLGMANTESLMRNRELSAARASDPDFAWHSALSQADPGHARGAQKIRALAEQNPDLNVADLIGSFTTSLPEDRSQKGLRKAGYTQDIEEAVQAILKGDSPSVWTRADPEVLRQLTRTWAS